jgi:D-serine deaminase-like pyridoxal phosphate-dependent protein
MAKLLQSTASLPTPFLIIEEKIVRKNINRIHDYANRHGFSVRPHIKTHKSLKISRMQLDSGAVGLAVAKVQEAEVMARLGPVDITVAYPAVGSTRTERIAKLSLKQKIRVAVDSEYLLNELGSSALKHGTCIGILVIFDPGLGRCGTADPVQIVTLARHAKTHPGLRFDGIQMYLGHLYGDPARDPHSFEQINRLW